MNERQRLFDRWAGAYDVAVRSNSRPRCSPLRGVRSPAPSSSVPTSSTIRTLRGCRFDRIVSAYVLHEFALSTKISLLVRLVRDHLANGGGMIIGDIAFPAVKEREEAHRRWSAQWDEEEHYWAADEAIAACERAGLHARYVQVSHCGGISILYPVLIGWTCLAQLDGVMRGTTKRLMLHQRGGERT